MLCLLGLNDLIAQQDPQYTQYMYNTMSVNPAYAGTRGHSTIVGLARTQWVGFEGAPDTQTLAYDTPLGYSNKVGLGFNLVNDIIGPSIETSLDANVSYSIETSMTGNLSFGLKLGGRLLNIDWSKGKNIERGIAFKENITNKFLPTIGAGLYYYTEKWYAGLSVPNFLQSSHYDERNTEQKLAEEEIHYFLIAGYVFDLTEDIKFKPAALAKAVVGAPLSIDVSANFLLYDKFRAGLAWRWDDSISALLGFHVNQSLYVGYAYDLTTTNYRVTNSGTHELMLRYEFLNFERMRSPRFF